jgi:hypothetical protein
MEVFITGARPEPSFRKSKTRITKQNDKPKTLVHLRNKILPKTDLATLIPKLKTKAYVGATGSSAAQSPSQGEDSNSCWLGMQEARTVRTNRKAPHAGEPDYLLQVSLGTIQLATPDRLPKRKRNRQ